MVLPLSSCCVVLCGSPWMQDAMQVGLKLRLLVLPLLLKCIRFPEQRFNSCSCVPVQSKHQWWLFLWSPSSPHYKLSVALSDGKDTTCQLAICLIAQLSASAINLVTELKLSPNYIESHRNPGCWGEAGSRKRGCL